MPDGCRVTAQTPEGRLTRALLVGDVDFERQVNDFDGNEARLSGLFLATIASLTARRFGPSPDGRDVTRFVARSLTSKQDDGAYRRETEAAIWFLMGDLELSDVLSHDVIMDAALDVTQPLVRELGLSLDDIDALVVEMENHTQWVVEHQAEVPSPPDHGQPAGWDEWRRGLADALAKYRARHAG
jgi:hypothetical protein